MTGYELAAEIDAGRMWSECHGPKCSNEIHDGYLVTTDDSDDTDRGPIRLSDFDRDAVFCCTKCRQQFDANIQKVGKRRRRTIAKAIEYFGPSVRIKYACGDARSGWCQCDSEKMHTEYPGHVDVLLPGLLGDVSGCPWCRQFGVQKRDVESYRDFMKKRTDDDI